MRVPLGQREARAADVEVEAGQVLGGDTSVQSNGQPALEGEEVTRAAEL